MSNNFTIYIIICSIIGYLFGSIPVGYLVAKHYGVNIFEVGSKNPGSTNVGRILGKTVGMLVYFLDLAKTFIAIIIALFIFNTLYKNGIIVISIQNSLTSMTNILSNELRYYYAAIVCYTGLFVIIGHNYPFTMKFKGGKGITCTLAAFFMINPIFAIIDLILHKIIEKITKYVSVASIISLLLLIIVSVIGVIFNIYPYNFNGSSVVLIPIIAYSLLGIYRHKANIRRLINGTESKIKS